MSSKWDDCRALSSLYPYCGGVLIMECPQCHSSVVQRTEIAWQAQVSHMQTSGQFVPGGYQPAVHLTHRTHLGYVLSPPSPPSPYRIPSRFKAWVVTYVLGGLAGLLPGLLYVGVIAATFSRHTLAVRQGLGFGIGLIGAAFVVIGVIAGWIVAWRYFRRPPKNYATLHTAYNAALDRWQREWFCPQCGCRKLPGRPSVVSKLSWERMMGLCYTGLLFWEAGR